MSPNVWSLSYSSSNSFYITTQKQIKHSGLPEMNQTRYLCVASAVLYQSNCRSFALALESSEKAAGECLGLFCWSGSVSHVVPDVSDGERCGDSVSGAGAVSAAELHQQHRHVLRGRGGPALLTQRYTTIQSAHTISFCL